MNRSRRPPMSRLVGGWVAGIAATVIGGVLTFFALKPFDAPQKPIGPPPNPVAVSEDSSVQQEDPEARLRKIEQAWRTISLSRDSGCADYGQREAVRYLAEEDRLAGANLSSLCLSGIDLRDRNLARVDFSSSGLEDAVFDNSNLTLASFHQASLDGASFDGALMAYTDLTAATLLGADLRHAKVLTVNARDATLDAGIHGRVLLDRDALKGLCYDLEYEAEVSLGQQATVVPLTGRNAEACFWADKPLKLDEMKQIRETWAGSAWRRWRDGECAFDDNTPEHCYAA